VKAKPDQDLDMDPQWFGSMGWTKPIDRQTYRLKKIL
jgi:hypothetical protein